MNGEAARERTEVPVACRWSALSAVQQERQRVLYRQLRANVQEVVELEDGYAFRHSSDRAVLLAVAEFVANERLCCPFFEFGIHRRARRRAGVVAHEGRGWGQASPGGRDGHRRLKVRRACIGPGPSSYVRASRSSRWANRVRPTSENSGNSASRLISAMS